MHIVFSAHNFTTDHYLLSLSKSNNVYVFRNFDSTTPKLNLVNEIEVKYGLVFIETVLRYFKIDRVRPEYIKDFKKNFPTEEPGALVVVDFYHFTFWQFLQYKKKNPATKLYLWSETRRWPQFWLSRWLMHGFWWYFKKNLQYVDKVFVFTEEGENFFKSRLPNTRVEIFPAPVDIKKFSPDPNKLWLPQEKLRVLINARFVPLKDHKTLLRALKILKNKSINFELSLIGRGGHLKEGLLNYAEKLGLREKIAVLETVSSDNLRNIYTTHDVLVLPSYREAIGMVVPEAMACGIPTVTSKAVGANVYVKDGSTGYIFETGKVAELALKLELLTDKNRLEAFGAAAHDRIRHNYSQEILGAKFASNFKK